MMDAAELQRRLRGVRDEATGLRATLAERDAEIARLRASNDARDNLIAEMIAKAQMMAIETGDIWWSRLVDEAVEARAALSPERINSAALTDLIAADADLYDKG